MKLKMYISILIITIIVSSVAITNFRSIATSDTEANIIVDSKNVVQGNEVNVNINLQNSVDFIAGNFILQYDNTNLEYKEYTVGSSLKKSDGTINGTIALNAQTSGKIKIGYMSDANETNETKSAGVLLTLTFNIKSGAGTNSMLDLNCTTLKKADGTNVTAQITDGELRIISGLQIDTSSLDLEVGKSCAVQLITLPTSVDISNEIIDWRIGNEVIATVDSKGIVTALSPGNTKLTATLLGLTAECNINVTSSLKSISLNKTELILNIGESETLQVTYNPENTTDNKNVTWTSSEEDIATVDENGNITAISSGKATITATVCGKTDTCEIIVLGKLGDVDKDNNITAYDAYKVLVTSVDILTGIEVGDEMILVSDVDKDKEVTAQDAYNILQYSVGLIDEF